jgi:hypothetical protein
MDIDELPTMPRDPGLGVHRNVYDLQRIAAVKRLDRQIAEDHANGYGVDRDALLDRRLELMQLLRLGPTSLLPIGKSSSLIGDAACRGSRAIGDSRSWRSSTST